MKPLTLAAGVAPLAGLAWRGASGSLGANPIEAITHGTGGWALRLLLVTLAITPIRRVTGWNEIIRLRRMLGLLAFFYACLHLITYLWLDQFFSWPDIAKDVAKRPFITAGTAGLLLMVPLALTSTGGMIRRLGGRRWRQLHRLVYLSAALAVVHFWWLVKADVARPRRYLLVLVVLLGARLVPPVARAVARRRR